MDCSHYSPNNSVLQFQIRLGNETALMVILTYHAIYMKWAHAVFGSCLTADSCLGFDVWWSGGGAGRLFNLLLSEAQADLYPPLNPAELGTKKALISQDWRQMGLSVLTSKPHIASPQLHFHHNHLRTQPFAFWPLLSLFFCSFCPRHWFLPLPLPFSSPPAVTSVLGPALFLPIEWLKSVASWASLTLIVLVCSLRPLSVLMALSASLGST